MTETTPWVEKRHIVDGTRCWCKNRAGQLNLHLPADDPKPEVK